MKQIILFISLLYFTVGFAQNPGNDPHWQLLWQDDFNFLNTDIWEVLNDFDHGGEDAIARTNNVSVSNGNLVLELKKESYLDHAYTTGNVNTNPANPTHFYNPQFGYIEARIKLPYGNGFWPSFWAWTNIPYEQEIDIFEMIPGGKSDCNPSIDQTNNVMTTNIHSVIGGNNTPDVCHTNTIQDYTQWHTYAIEWSPSRIIWYLDNDPVRYYQNSLITSKTALILAIGVRDKFVDPSTPFPAYMYVDYVKVYKLHEDCNDFINSSNYDFSTYNNEEKNFIRIGEGGGNNSLSVGADITLRASQYIEINGDFSVPLGASFYADANKDCSTDMDIGCTETFNPCLYDFSNYDNSVKKIIDLGDNGCIINITSSNNDLLLEATDKITLNPGVTITPAIGKLINIEVVQCH